MLTQKTKLSWGDGIGNEVDDVVIDNSLKHFRNNTEQEYWLIVVYKCSVTTHVILCIRPS